MFKTLIILQKQTKKTNWQEIPDHPYRLLIVWGSQSGKRNVLLNK